MARRGRHAAHPRLRKLEQRPRGLEDLAARTAATIHLVDWAGGHRQAFDDHRETQEGVLSGAELEAEIARLRGAWDNAAAAQHRANRNAADAADAPSGVPVPR